MSSEVTEDLDNDMDQVEQPDVEVYSGGEASEVEEEKEEQIIKASKALSETSEHENSEEGENDDYMSVDETVDQIDDMSRADNINNIKNDTQSDNDNESNDEDVNNKMEDDDESMENENEQDDDRDNDNNDKDHDNNEDDKEIEDDKTKMKTVEEVKKAHPGVFDFSTEKEERSEKDECSEEDEDEEDEDVRSRISPPTTRKTRSKVAEEIKNTKEILASLPCVERLRPLNGSTLSADKSETGEYASDRDSVYSGGQTMGLRKKNKSEKVKTGVVKKLNTRSGKGKGRRSICKKKPVKSISLAPTPITSKKIYYKGEYFTVGDIVSVTDDSGDIYYGQLRGFLTDEYGNKSAVMSWLLPTTGSPPPNEGFHPATYIIGPDEDVPRSMEVFTFVMHAPSDYFHNRSAPYRTSKLPPKGQDNVTMMRLGPRVIRTVDNKTVYVGIYS